jgi:glutamate dehydrogenase/leucine dehydrogenase
MSTSTTTGTTTRPAAAVVEAVPTTWSTADEEFFLIAGQLFAPAMLAGAGVMLASYDEAVT